MKNSEIIHCDYCGSSILNGLNRCPVCNTKVSSSKNQGYKKSSLREEDSVSCSFCGNNFEEDVIEEENNEYDWSGFFLLLSLISLLSVFYIHIIGFLFFFLFVLVGKITCPKNKVMSVVFWGSVVIFTIVLFIVLFIIYFFIILMSVGN